MRDVALCKQLRAQIVPIRPKAIVEEPPYVLEENRARLALTHKSKRGRKEVTFVISAELFSCLRKWRAWNATGKQVDSSAVLNDAPISEISLERVPVGPVSPEGGTGMFVEFDYSKVFEPSLL
jgi:hypothetical protein